MHWGGRCRRIILGNRPDTDRSGCLNLVCSTCWEISDANGTLWDLIHLVITDVSEDREMQDATKETSKQLHGAGDSFLNSCKKLGQLQLTIILCGSKSSFVPLRIKLYWLMVVCEKQVVLLRYDNVFCLTDALLCNTSEDNSSYSTS